MKKLILTTFIAILSGCATSTEDAITPIHPAIANKFSRSALHDAFIKTAFGIEVQDADSRPGIYVRKFADPIRYTIISKKVDDEKESEVQSRLIELAWKTGLDISPASGFNQTNYFVYIYPVEEKSKWNRLIMEEQQYNVSESRLKSL